MTFQYWVAKFLNRWLEGELTDEEFMEFSDNFHALAAAMVEAHKRGS
jgi:hypothetical protein